jgi:hypothetical protein
MVSRRPGQICSHLACVTGMHQILPKARILPQVAGQATAAAIRSTMSASIALLVPIVTRT